jgi:hypothetical protein
MRPPCGQVLRSLISKNEWMDGCSGGASCIVAHEARASRICALCLSRRGTKETRDREAKKKQKLPQVPGLMQSTRCYTFNWSYRRRKTCPRRKGECNANLVGRPLWTIRGRHQRRSLTYPKHLDCQLERTATSRFFLSDEHDSDHFTRILELLGNTSRTFLYRWWCV